MANDCLFKKLKGVINNDNLPKLGVIKGAVPVGEYNGVVHIQANQGCRPIAGKTLEITILDDSITITGAQNGATMIDSKHGIISDAYNSRLLINGITSGDSKVVQVEVKQKYDLMAFWGAYVGDLSDFKYSTGLAGIMFNPAYGRSQGGIPNKITGNIADLAHLTNLTRYCVEYMPDIYGSINDLGPLVNLTTFDFSWGMLGNGITGTFDGFVEAQKANGRTSCNGITIPHADNFRLSIGNSNVIWNDSSGTLEATLKWSGSKIDMFMTSKQKAYVIGYTQSEIDTMTASGGVYAGYTVVKCD